MQRNDYMDFLKGICILSVIIGHSISNFPEMSVFFNIIYSFHMPLLMFISAYIEENSRKKYENRFSYMLFKRAEGLLLPYFVWNLCYCGRLDGEIQLSCAGLWNRLTGHTQTGLWFLAVLFGLKCVHTCYWYVLKKTSPSSLLKKALWMCLLEIVIVGLAAITKASYIVNMVSYAIPYFCGIFWASEPSVQKAVHSEGVIFLTSLVYLIAFQIFDFHQTAPTTQVIRIFLSLCVIVPCCKYQDSWSKNYPWKSQLCFLGRFSLEIYLLHGYFLDYSSLLQKIDSRWLAGVTSILLSIGIAYTCIFVAQLINISKFFSKILFGKS